MGKFLGKLLVTACAAIIAAYFIPGVSIDNSVTAIILALVLALLNSFIKPILIILTIPLTILTLGLFLIVINILIIKWAADIVDGFKVDGWFSALLFSLLLSIATALIESLLGTNRKEDLNK
jgi:putative membrane protein